MLVLLIWMLCHPLVFLVNLIMYLNHIYIYIYIYIYYFSFKIIKYLIISYDT